MQNTSSGFFSISVDSGGKEDIDKGREELRAIYTRGGRKNNKITYSDIIAFFRQKGKRADFLANMIHKVHEEYENKLEIVKKYCKSKGVNLDYEKLFGNSDEDIDIIRKLKTRSGFVNKKIIKEVRMSFDEFGNKIDENITEYGDIEI